MCNFAHKLCNIIGEKVQLVIKKFKTIDNSSHFQEFVISCGYKQSKSREAHKQSTEIKPKFEDQLIRSLFDIIFISQHNLNNKVQKPL